MLIFPWFKLDANERVAAPMLIRELGVLGALRVGRRIRRRQEAGEPFDVLEPPDSDNERLSREQIGPAVLLYEEIRREFGQARALRVTEAVVNEAAVLFLRAQIGELRREELARLNEEGRRRFVEERGSRFFNATVQWDEISGESVQFTVTHCRFPPLCEALGVPELAPVFCKGDATFFGTVEPDVELIRPKTIASGDATCQFHLRWLSRD